MNRWNEYKIGRRYWRQAYKESRDKGKDPGAWLLAVAGWAFLILIGFIILAVSAIR